MLDNSIFRFDAIYMSKCGNSSLENISLMFMYSEYLVVEGYLCKVTFNSTKGLKI